MSEDIIVKKKRGRKPKVKEESKPEEKLAKEDNITHLKNIKAYL